MNAKEVWRRRTKELVASGLPVGEWCKINAVESTGMHRYLKLFRDTEPELFGGYEKAHAGDNKRFWYEEVRQYSIQDKVKSAFIEVELLDTNTPYSPITIDLISRSAKVDSDTDPKAISALLKAMMGL